MDSILELLNRKYCIEVFILIAENPGATKTDILNLTPDNERSKFLRIGDLVKYGLVQMDNRARQHNSIKLYLTPLGQVIYGHIGKIIEAYDSEMKSR